MSHPQKIRKAVIAAAGFGTRFLPQTKAMPKEMLPLVDKPIIQYIVEELVDAGVEDIVIVTGYHKRAIEDHFDTVSADLARNLVENGKDELLAEVETISNMANFVYVRQKGPYGNATPLINAEHLIDNEPFLFAFADDFVQASPSCFRQLISVYTQHGGSVLTCVRTDRSEDYARYAYVGGERTSNDLLRVTRIVEKPGNREAAPSSLASVSGYLLSPPLFDYLHKQLEELPPGAELNLQASLQRMLEDDHDVYAHEIQNGRYYDTGNKLGYIKAIIDFALQRDDLRSEIKAYLRKLTGNL